MAEEQKGRKIRIASSNKSKKDSHVKYTTSNSGKLLEHTIKSPKRYNRSTKTVGGKPNSTPRSPHKKR